LIKNKFEFKIEATMEPLEKKYRPKPHQINVHDINGKIKSFLTSKSNLKKKSARTLMERVEELYDLFYEQEGIDKESSYFIQRKLSWIDNKHDFWFTWFSFELVCKSSVLLTNLLEEHYNRADKPDEFLNSLLTTLRFLSGPNLDSFEFNLLKIKGWIDAKKSYSLKNSEYPIENEDRYSPNGDIESVTNYFKLLSDKGLLSLDQVEKLVIANFNFGNAVPREKLNIKLPKSHLTYFVCCFFKKYGFNEKNKAIHTSQFLRFNFLMYKKESLDEIKEYNLRKNFRSILPKKYELHF
jgi:hypothetical protein